MRKLNTQDVFKALRCIKSSGLREELRPVMEMASKDGASIRDVGIEFMLQALEIISEARTESAIYEFLAGPFEMSAEDVSCMDINDLGAALELLAAENDLKGFFTTLQRILGKK